MLSPSANVTFTDAVGAYEHRELSHQIRDQDQDGKCRDDRKILGTMLADDRRRS